VSDVITLFERGDVVAQAHPAYDSDTGRRLRVELWLVKPGGRLLWAGEPDELDDMIDLLQTLRIALDEVPGRILPRERRGDGSGGA
jgi:hypothetical protein